MGRIEQFKRARQTDRLKELVAEYPNFILGSPTPEYGSDSFIKKRLLDIELIYHKFGPTFLLELARMSLDEAIKMEIIE